jgi:hypothetical protein
VAYVGPHKLYACHPYVEGSRILWHPVVPQRTGARERTCVLYNFQLDLFEGSIETKGACVELSIREEANLFDLGSIVEETEATGRFWIPESDRDLDSQTIRLARSAPVARPAFVASGTA